MSKEIGDRRWLESTGATVRAERENAKEKPDCDGSTAVGNPGRYVTIHCNQKMGHPGRCTYSWDKE